MFDFHEKRKIRRIIYSKFFIGGVLLIALFVGGSVYERFTIEREMAEKLDARTAELKALEARAAALGSKVEHLKNERGIEEELRTRFDVVKEGEQVVIILDDEPELKKEISIEADAMEERSFLERLKFW